MNMMKLLAVGGVLVALAGCEKEVEIRSADFYEANIDITKQVLAECASGKKMSMPENENCKNAKMGMSQIYGKAAREGTIMDLYTEEEIEKLVEETKRENQRRRDEAKK